MKKLSLVLAMVCLGVSMMFAQRTVTGTVTDSNGQPLIGASILVQGTTSGTVTDIDGAFSISVPEAASSLLVSYTGFETQTVTLDASNVVNVTLREGITIDEVIVTAVGLESNRRQLGYSVQNVDAAELLSARETNLVNALNGKVAGVSVTSSSGTPGASSNIRIRGATSIGRSNAPLFVIDGVPIDNSEQGNGVGGVDQSNRAIDINPNDIASLTVLKGAAATALYGVRAANGAIVVTTKKGQEGKARITVSANYALDEVNRLPEFQQTYAQGGPVNGVTTYRGPHTAEGNSWGPAIADLEFATDPSAPGAPAAQYFIDGQYVFDQNGYLVPRGQGNGTPARAYDPYTFFKTGNTYDVNLSAQGGTDRARYYLSAGRLGATGVVPNSEWSRTSLRVTADANLTDKLTAGFSANYVNSGGFRIQRGSNIQGVMVGIIRNTPTFDTGNGKEGQEAADDPSSYVLANGAQRSYRAGVYDSPYWVVNKNPYRDDVNRIIGYGSLGYQLTPSLRLGYKLGMDQYSDRRNWAFDINNQYFGAFQGAVNQAVYINRDLNSDLLLQFNNQLTQSLGLSAVVGHNYFDTRYISQTTTGTTLATPNFYNISNATTIQGSEGVSRKRLVGVYGTLDFNLNQYLFLNLTGRNDWTSTLPADANDFQSYSASLGLAFSDLLNLPANSFLSYGKLRLSYGKVGNDAPIYATSNYFGSAASGGDGFIGAISFPVFGVNAFERSTQLGNNQLRPESTTTYEIGTELKFLRGRIGLDLTYYNATSKDQVIGVQVSASSGFTSLVQNAGEIENKGIEAVLNLQPVAGQNFGWDIDVNFTTYENNVISLAEGIEQIGLAGFTSTQSVVQAGQPYGAIWGDPFARNEQGQRLISATGWPILGTRKIVLGDPNPDWFAGIRNTFTLFRNLQVSALLDIRQGGDVWCGTCGIMDYFGTSQRSADTRNETVVFEGVLPDGTPNNIAVPYADPATGVNSFYFYRYGFGGITEMTVYDASWVRLRELTLSVGLPASLLQRAKIESGTITFTGRNLWLSTEYPGVDPETNLTGATNGVGLDYFNLPNTRSYNLGFNVTF